MSGYKPQIRARPKANKRAAPRVEAHHCIHGPDTGKKFERTADNNKKMKIEIFSRVSGCVDLRDC